METRENPSVITDAISEVPLNQANFLKSSRSGESPKGGTKHL